MRRKIQDIINGRFESSGAGLDFEDSMLSITVLEGGSRKASFSFSSARETAVRGLVSCSDPRMEIVSPTFDAVHVTVPVVYHGEDLCEHETQTGSLVVLTNAGEFLYPYEVTVTKDYAHTSIGVIRNLTDFTNLARLNWQEALSLFGTSRFTQIFHPGEERESTLYQALVSRAADSAQMEEFLVACGRKMRNHFLVTDSHKRYMTGTRPINDRILIEKTQWGHLQFHVRAEGDFIELSDPAVPEDAASVKKLSIAYRILPEKMHGGINCGRILIEDIQECVQVGITAVSENYQEPGEDSHKERRLLTLLQQDFMDFCLQKLNKAAWTQKAGLSLAQLQQIPGMEPAACLGRCFVLYQNGEIKEYIRCLERYEREYAHAADSPAAGLYLYLTTLRNTDTKYIRSVTSQVRRLHKRYEDNAMLVWILLRIDEALIRNDERAYQFIRGFAAEYSGNPFLYLEAYMLLKENPLLAASEEPGVFEQRLLRWIAKNDLLTWQILLPVWERLKTTHTYSRWCFAMLTAVYKKNRSVSLLKEICIYLIRTERFGQDYIVWYERGVRSGLRIAGLYEAYLRSFDAASNELLPEIIKYFIMSSDAPDKWKAAVYSYLIRHRKAAGEDWPHLRTQICEFARETLRRDEISDDLYVIYDFLRGEISREEWLALSTCVQHCRRVRLKDRRFKRLFLYDAQKHSMSSVLLHGRQAYVHMPETSAAILLQDKEDHLYTTEGFADVEVLFKRDAKQGTPDSGDGIREAEEEKERLAADLNTRLEAFSGTLCELDGLIMEALGQEIYCLPYEEKLLTYMLFAGELTAHHERFFADVCRAGENTRICDAYISVLARAYVCRDKQMHEAACAYLLQAAGQGRNLNAFCRTAVLKLHYAKPKAHILAEENAQRLLLRLLNDGYCFEFFHTLPDALKRKYLIDGMLFVQCCAEPKQKIHVHAVLELPGQPDGNNIEFADRMKEALPGLYCYAVPVVPGATVRFRMTDENDDVLMMYAQTVGDMRKEKAVPDRYQALSALADRPEKEDTRPVRYAARSAWFSQEIEADPIMPPGTISQGTDAS